MMPSVLLWYVLFSLKTQVTLYFNFQTKSNISYKSKPLTLFQSDAKPFVFSVKIVLINVQTKLLKYFSDVKLKMMAKLGTLCKTYYRYSTFFI